MHNTQKVFHYNLLYTLTPHVYVLLLLLLYFLGGEEKIDDDVGVVLVRVRVVKR